MFDSVSRDIPISCEFPIENLPFKLEAHKIGDTTMLIFSGNEKVDYFVIAVKKDSIYIGCPGE